MTNTTTGGATTPVSNNVATAGTPPVDPQADGTPTDNIAAGSFQSSSATSGATKSTGSSRDSRRAATADTDDSSSQAAQTVQPNATNTATPLAAAVSLPTDGTTTPANAENDLLLPVGQISGRGADATTPFAGGQQDPAPTAAGNGAATLAAATANGRADARTSAATANTTPPDGNAVQPSQSGSAPSALANALTESTAGSQTVVPGDGGESLASAVNGAGGPPHDSTAPQGGAAPSNTATAGATAIMASAQPAATTGTNTLSSTSDAVRVPMSELAVTVAGQVQSGKSEFEVRLDPPDLGRIDVRLSVDSAGNVGVRLVAERSETLDLLRQDAPQLERSLQDAGLDMSGGMQFSLGNQGYAGHNNFAASDTSPAVTTSAVPDETASVTAVPAYSAWSGRSGGLDITV